MLVEAERIRSLNNAEIGQGEFVLYWMQSSQRVEFNHSLIHAIERANKLNQPLLISFGLIEYPEANSRHYRFMAEGLLMVQDKLIQMGAGLAFKRRHPANLCIELSKDASLVVLDRPYLRKDKEWCKQVNERISCPVIQIESNVVVPIESASEKEEYSAATLRRKLVEKYDRYLHEVKVPELVKRYRGEESYLKLESVKDLDVEEIPPSPTFTGGYREAHRLLDLFNSSKLDGYPDKKNDPTIDFVSHMSPYLHFGQISPVEIALRVKETGSRGIESYLEELIVRRELAVNFVHYNPHYDSIECLPSWCRETINKHRSDRRTHIYTRDELEEADTHDPYWNAAQQEMVKNGKMHGYMRMYWGKKIIEWTKIPEEAYYTALYLNNKYELDGRDPNGYAGVAWCFGKHDRPWKERPIFGKLRYMNDRGLERKFKIREYVEKWASS